MKSKIILTEEIKGKAIKSVKWTALSEIASRSIQPIVTLILARLLTPADFGVVGVAMIAIGLAQIFQDFGLGKTLIQRETEVEKSANIVFWTNLALSIVIYFIIFLSAPLLSKFFHDPKVIDVLRVLCLQIVFISLIVVHQALFQRNFQYKQLFFIRLSSSAVPGFVSIPLALLGYGVWALVFGSLAGAFVQVLLFWKFSQWRPKISYDVKLARQLLGFSTWVVLEAFILWVLFWGDSIVLGHFLGVKELGVYRVGVTFLLLVFAVFLNPILPVAYSAFSRLQSNPEELKQLYLRATTIIAYISMPLGVVLAFLAFPISHVIFGQKWEGIALVIGVLGLKDGLTSVAGLNPEVLRASGKASVYPKIWVSLFLLFIPTYIWVAPYGLKVFCIARFTVSIIGLIIQLTVTIKILKLSFKTYLNIIKHPFFICMFLAVVLFFLTKLLVVFQFSYYYFNIFIVLLFTPMLYFILIRFCDKEFYRSTANIIKQII